MSKKTEKLDKIKRSDFFPQEYEGIYEKDYDELIEEEKVDIKKNIVELESLGYSLYLIQNLIQSKIYSSLNIDDCI